MPAQRIVTTSWDDGDVLDLKVAEYLCSRGISGTFYVPIEPYRGRPALSHAHLRSLYSAGFEVGGHGVAHENISTLSGSAIAGVVGTCKKTLEDIVGAEVRVFCYPGGRYNLRAVRCLRKAGYWGARTTRMLATQMDFTPFEMPTTVQVYPHTRVAYVKNALRARKIGRLCDYLTRFSRIHSWIELGKRLFDRVLREGGIWHLYGHSWEIEERGLWNELAKMLDHVSGRGRVLYMRNGDVLGFLNPKARESQTEQKIS